MAGFHECGRIAGVPEPAQFRVPAFSGHVQRTQTPRILRCPEDKERKIAIDWQIDNQNISYFLGLDATEPSPQMWLAGDRNLMTNGLPVGSGLLQLTTNLTVGWTARMHNSAGYMLFGDGHVDSFSNGRLQEQLNYPSVATHRLLIP